MKETTISAKINGDLKAKVGKVLHSLSLTHSQAISMFYSQINLQHGIPFDIKLPKELSDVTISAMEENNLKEFNDVNDFLNDLK